jgi:hypothetical protein
MNRASDFICEIWADPRPLVDKWGESGMLAGLEGDDAERVAAYLQEAVEWISFHEWEDREFIQFVIIIIRRIYKIRANWYMANLILEIHEFVILVIPTAHELYPDADDPELEAVKAFCRKYMGLELKRFKPIKV